MVRKALQKTGTRPKSKASKRQGNQAIKVKKPNSAVEQTAPTIWSSLTDPSLATIDVYKQNQSGTLNSISEFANTFDFGLAGLLQGGSSLAGKLSQAMQFYGQAKEALNNGISLDRLSSLSPLVRSGMANLGIQEGSDLFKKIETSSEFLIKVGETAHRVQNTNWKDLNAVTGLINDLSGGANGLFQLSDLSAQAQYVVSLVNQATSMGIPNSLGALKDLIKHNPLLNEIVSGILPETMKWLDTDGLKTIVDLVGSEFVSSLKGDLLSQYGEAYTKEYRDQHEHLADQERYVAFKSLAKKIDTDSFYTVRRGIKILDLSKLLSATDEFKQLIETSVREERDDWMLLGLCNHWSQCSVRSELERDFPRIAWIEDQIEIRPTLHSPLSF